MAAPLRNAEAIDFKKNKMIDTLMDANVVDIRFKRERSQKQKGFLHRLRHGRLGNLLLILLLLCIAGGILYFTLPAGDKPKLPDLQQEIQNVFVSLDDSKENYAKGIKAYNAKRWNEAIASFKGVVEKDPDYSDAQEKMKSALFNQAYSSKYEKGFKAMNEKDWVSAENYLRDIPEDAPYYKDAQENLQKAQAMIASEESFKKGVDIFKKHDLDGAQLLLEQVDSKDANYDEAQKVLEEINNERADMYLANARSKISENDYKSARSYLQKADQYRSGTSKSSGLSDEIDTIENNAFSESYKEDAKRYSYKEVNESAK